LDSKSTSPIPEPIVQLQRRFDEFLGSRPHRTKLHETLLQAAVELARERGLMPDERLRLHQERSRPVMDRLHK
jgi:hypothetical protein